PKMYYVPINNQTKLCATQKQNIQSFLKKLYYNRHSIVRVCILDFKLQIRKTLFKCVLKIFKTNLKFIKKTIDFKKKKENRANIARTIDLKNIVNFQTLRHIN